MQQIAGREYAVKFEQGADGGWGAYVPELPGVGVAAETREEVERLIGEAISLHIAPDSLDSGVAMIANERARQIAKEQFTPEHDDQHNEGQLLSAAVCYVDMADTQIDGYGPLEGVPFDWPWDRTWWKPSPDPIRNLTKAAALIASEIDRLQRAANKKEAPAQ